MRLLFQISVLLLTLQRGTSTGRYYNNKVTATVYIDTKFQSYRKIIRLVVLLCTCMVVHGT